MREKYQKQRPLMTPAIDHPHAKELEETSRIFNVNFNIIDLTYQELIAGVFNSILKCPV